MASTSANDSDATESAATQAMEVLRLVDTTSDTTTVPRFYGDPDIPADEMAISIDHIREQLFALLTPKDLFNCRRLNRQWNSYATAELQERFELKCTIKEETLEEYLSLLQKHQKIFPCLPLPIFRKHSFEKETLDILSDPLLEQFLRTYGYFIRDLALNQNSTYCCQEMLPNEKDALEQVRTLLVHSAPNLSSLRMDKWGLKKPWAENTFNRYPDSTPLRTTDPEFEEIRSIPKTEKNENLKLFSYNPMTGKMLELAIQLAPNLEEIQVRPTPDGRNHKYFIEPLNRLRFCKNIEYSAESSDLFRAFANLAQEGDLKLEQFSFMFGKKILFDGRQDGFMEKYVEVDVAAINTILSCSWDSLETISWSWVMRVPGLKWPDVMPNVSRIDLGPCHNSLQDGLLAFPPDFIWSTTFPRLRELHFCEAIQCSEFQQLLQCFKSQCLDSVEEVHVLQEIDEKPQERVATTSVNFEQLRNLCPSAQVLSSWSFANFYPTSTDYSSDSTPSSYSDGHWSP